MHYTHQQPLITTMKNYTLSLPGIQAAAEAAQQFIDEHGDQGMQFEVLMLFSYLQAHGTAAAATAAPSVQRWTLGNPSAQAQPPALAAVPDWFADGVKQFAGRKMTASAIMSSLGRPTDIKSLREAGAWLRQLYGEPTRSNGQTIFSIFGIQTGAAARAQMFADDPDAESAFAAGIPIGAKAINFAAIKQGGRYKPDEIARLMKLQGTQQEITEIGKALTQHGFQYHEDGSFDLSPRT